jgi:hypothetical protein
MNMTEKIAYNFEQNLMGRASNLKGEAADRTLFGCSVVVCAVLWQLLLDKLPNQ